MTDRPPPSALPPLVEAMPGAAAADCYVCGIDTYYRIAIGDGLAPVCSEECRRAFPRIREAREAIAYALRRATTDAEFRYHMLFTETFERLCRAHDLLSGLHAGTTRNEVMSAEDPPDEPRCIKGYGDFDHRSIGAGGGDD